MHEPGPKKQQYFTAMLGKRRAGQAANTIELLEALMREAMSAGTLCLDLCRALNLLAANPIKRTSKRRIIANRGFHLSWSWSARPLLYSL